MEKYKKFGLLVLTLLFALPAAAQLGEERHNFAVGINGCLLYTSSIANFCTANNTIAIITVGPLANDIATRYRVDKRKSASILDTLDVYKRQFLD